MTQTVLLGDHSGCTAGILLKSFPGIKFSGDEKESPERFGGPGEQEILMEILYPAEAPMPEKGIPLRVLPQFRSGELLQCRVVESNTVFLRLAATVRLTAQMEPE